MTTWIACHDTLVCAGAAQTQKWCVREGDKKGALVAVMLTKEVAHMLAGAPDMLAALKGLIEASGHISPFGPEPSVKAVRLAGKYMAAFERAAMSVSDLHHARFHGLYRRRVSLLGYAH
jgi:hypothetical protein